MSNSVDVSVFENICTFRHLLALESRRAKRIIIDTKHRDWAPRFSTSACDHIPVVCLCIIGLFVGGCSFFSKNTQMWSVFALLAASLCLSLNTHTHTPRFLSHTYTLRFLSSFSLSIFLFLVYIQTGNNNYSDLHTHSLSYTYIQTHTCTGWLHQVPLLALTHTRAHTLSFSLVHAQAGYINYCYSQQCIDRSSAPNSIKEGDKTLTDAWAQRTQDPPTPAGKVSVGSLCWYWMYVCRGTGVI